MIHEFAVEPEVMATWNHFRVLWDDFGVSRGRFLVEYPGGWRKKVYELAAKNSAPVKANAICSKLGDPAQRHRLVGASGRVYDPDKSWIDNAVGDHGENGAFRAIVTERSSAAHAAVIAAEDLVRDEVPWKVPTQDVRCPRQAWEMSRRVTGLVRHSKELVLVDRNFDPSEPRFQAPFEAFVGQAACWKRLELHTALPARWLGDVQESKYSRGLELRVPTGVTLKVCLWPGLPDLDRLHPRFVLTERGGVYFDYGLDEGPGTTLVTLLEHEVFLKLRDDYCETSRAFGAPRIIHVSGRG